MCSFNSFFHLFSPLFLFNKDRVSSLQPAVTTVNVPVLIPAYIIRIRVSPERTQSLEEENYASTSPAMSETLSSWRAVAGTDPASPISSMILQPAPQPHPLFTAGQSHVQHVRSQSNGEMRMAPRYSVWRNNLPEKLCGRSSLAAHKAWWVWRGGSFSALLQKYSTSVIQVTGKYLTTWYIPWPELQQGEAPGLPRPGKVFKLSHHQPWKGQEEGHGIFRNSLSRYPTRLLGITAPWCTHPSGSSEDGAHSALVVSTLKAA